MMYANNLYNNIFGKTFFNKFKHNKRNRVKLLNEVIAPARTDLLIYWLCVSMSFKINKVPKEIPIKCELLIFKNLRTLIMSSQEVTRLKSESKHIFLDLPCPLKSMNNKL